LKSIINKILIFIICFAWSLNGYGQSLTDSISIDIDSLSLLDTSVSRQIDTSNLKSIKISKDAITEIINYSALDSNFTDVANKEVHLYTKGDVKVENTNLMADYIVFYFEKNLAHAFEQKDSTYPILTKAKFKEGETEGKFKQIQYNFKSKKGYIQQLSTTQGEFFVNGKTSKMIGKDSLYPEGRLYQKDATISTCSHNPPHFGIRASKMKLIPKKLAIMGPAQLEIAGIPTPIILPFGFFPLIKGRSSGIIFPSDYTFDPNLGFGLQGIGYYFPINDNIDARVTSSIWSRGTHSVNVGANYNRRYKYNGNIDLNYTNNISENNEGKNDSQKSFGIRLSHNQDSKAHPYRSIGGSINIETNRNSQRTNYDFASQINNKLTSNFNYTYRWPESPFSVRAALSHSQDNRTRQMNITLPDASLSMNTIQPFKLKNSTGEQKWFENINVDYRSELKNYLKTSDTSLFTRATLDNLELGFKHGTNVSTNTRFLKYFSVSPSMSYEEVYFFKTLNKYLDPTTIFDSLSAERRVRYGTVKDTLQNDLSIYRNFTSSVSINTALFAMKRFSKGWLRGLRHTMKPSFSLVFNPQTRQRYEKYVDTDTRPTENLRQSYNPFSTGAFSQSLTDQQFAINYGIANVFEMKYRNKKDSIDKKFNIFNSFSFNGNYNFAADSFQWSDVNFDANADLIKGYSSIQFRGLMTPYEVDFKNGRRINSLLVKSATDKKLLQVLTFNIGVNSNISFTQIKDLISGKKPETQTNQNTKKRKGQPFSSLFDRLNFNHNLTFSYQKTKEGRDSFEIGANSLYVNGSFPLTKNWDLNVGSITYDFKAKSLVYPTFSLSRDLHCWNMRFNWVPTYGVYSFFIGVKSSALNFLKYDYNQPYVPRF
jgi:hypothetical protein